MTSLISDGITSSCRPVSFTTLDCVNSLDKLLTYDKKWALLLGNLESWWAAVNRITALDAFLGVCECLLVFGKINCWRVLSQIRDLIADGKDGLEKHKPLIEVSGFA